MGVLVYLDDSEISVNDNLWILYDRNNRRMFGDDYAKLFFSREIAENMLPDNFALYKVEEMRLKED